MPGEFCQSPVFLSAPTNPNPTNQYIPNVTSEITHLTLQRYGFHDTAETRASGICHLKRLKPYPARPCFNCAFLRPQDTNTVRRNSTAFTAGRTAAVFTTAIGHSNGGRISSA